jgi:hypothetical protein
LTEGGRGGKGLGGGVFCLQDAGQSY